MYFVITVLLYQLYVIISWTHYLYVFVCGIIVYRKKVKNINKNAEIVKDRCYVFFNIFIHDKNSTLILYKYINI